MMDSQRFDDERWDDIRIARLAILPTVLLALVIFWPHFTDGNASIPSGHRTRTVAAMVDSHCLDTPGPHHFVLCRQHVTYPSEGGRPVTSAVTVTEEFFEAHLDGLPVFFDKTNPEAVRPTEAPGFWWFFLDGLIKVAIRAVPATFAAFVLSFMVAKALKLRTSFG